MTRVSFQVPPSFCQSMTNLAAPLVRGSHRAVWRGSQNTWLPISTAPYVCSG